MEQPRLFSLDGNIYDKLAADAEAAQALADALGRGMLDPLLETYVLRDELANAPAETQALADHLPHRRVEVHGTIVGAWRLGEARLADPEPIAAIRGSTAQGNFGHARDALLLNTARLEGAVFVTEDARLLSRGSAEGMPVWSWSHFRAYVSGLLG